MSKKNEAKKEGTIEFRRKGVNSKRISLVLELDIKYADIETVSKLLPEAFSKMVQKRSDGSVVIDV